MRGRSSLLNRSLCKDDPAHARVYLVNREEAAVRGI